MVTVVEESHSHRGWRGNRERGRYCPWSFSLHILFWPWDGATHSQLGLRHSVPPLEPSSCMPRGMPFCILDNSKPSQVDREDCKSISCFLDNQTCDFEQWHFTSAPQTDHFTIQNTFSLSSHGPQILMVPTFQKNVSPDLYRFKSVL